MLLLSKLGAEIDDYPELTFTQGTLISNPIMGNFLSGNVNANKDFCVMGYDTPADQMILLCGSASADVDSAEYDVDVNYDLSDFQYYPNTLIHAVQSSQSTTGGVNLNEVLTPYGIISVIYTGSDRANLDYNITTSSFGISIPSDVEKTGYFDILYRTDNGLYYIDDGFTNEQINIDSFTFSRSPICVNRTYTMTVQFSDAEGDAGTCWVVVKLDNETNLWNTTNRTGASGVSIYIKPNETGYFFYDLYCTDGIAGTPDFERKQVDVNNDLDTCYEPGEADEVSNIEAPDEEVENEDFTEGVDSILDNFLLSSSKARNVLAIILSFAAAFIVYLKTRKLELALTAKISAAIVLFYLGIMSILPLVIIIIVCAYFISKSFIGGTPSSG
jgi:hypothetical protein